MRHEKDPLERAIAFLRAVDLGNGYYAWRGPEFESWVAAKAAAIVGNEGHFASAIDERDPVTILPDWWSPEQREAWQCDDCGYACATQDELARVCIAKSVSRVTVDYATGEEVPA